MPKIFSKEDRRTIKNKLISLGLESLESKGYKYTSVEDIARAAGIAKGTFYSFYPSKEQFFYEIMLAIRDNNRRELQAVVRGGPGNVRDRMAEYIYERYATRKNVYHYFSLEELKIIFRKIPDQKAYAHMDSKAFAEELLKNIPGAGPRLKTGVIVNMMNVLGSFSANRQTMSAGCYEETVRLLVDALANYIFGERG